jgi:F-type H+-transporting ATPase subunit alpha
VKSKASDILDSIRNEKAISKETEEKLKSFMENFAKTFA